MAIVVAQDGLASSTDNIDTTPADLLATSGSQGLPVPKAARWILTAKNTGSVDATVKLYKRAGSNAAFVLVASYTVVATTGTLTVECDAEAAEAVRFTAETASSTTTMAADFRAVGQTI